MRFSLRPTVGALGLAIASAAALGAQGAPKECQVDESRPTALGKATIAVQVASSTQDPGAASRQLINAVRGLTDNAERMDNQVGRNFVLGKALVLWTLQPNVDLTARRGSIGYSANPEATTDLAAAIDTAFKVVETASPECIPETSKWRGQKAWVTLVNKAIERLNADDVDAAESAARRAILLNPWGPYGYVVLGNVMQKRAKATEAFAMYRRSVDVASRDTLYDEIRRQSLIYLGSLAADSAEATTDTAAKRPYIDAAKAAFDRVIQEKNAGDFHSNARSGMCRIAITSGDTASLRVTYKEPLASSATFSYNELMSAGVCMARAEMVPEATVLFQAAYEKNPWHRDALSNLSIMLLQLNKHDEALPLAQRLVSVEPNNPENLQLLVLSYAGIAKRSRDARTGGSKSAAATKAKTGAKAPPTKAAPAAPRLSAAVSDSMFKIEQVYSDSAFKANDRREKLGVRVSLSDFTMSEEKATVAGTVINQGTAEKTVTVKVEFLDKAGAVVATKETSVGPLAAGKNGRFTVTTTPGKGISAFRYVRID